MPYEFKLKRMVEFAETDMAGIMHFSNYFRFMEATEHAFFRSLGGAVHVNDGGAMHGWARVRAECSYRSPLHYQDMVEVHLLVREKRERSIRYDFVFRRVDPSETGDGAAIAHGSVTVVCVERAAGDARMRSRPMPAEIAATIDVAPPAALAVADELRQEGT